MFISSMINQYIFFFKNIPAITGAILKILNTKKYLLFIFLFFIIKKI